MNIDSADMSNGRQLSAVNKNRSNTLSCSVIKMGDPENQSNKTVQLMTANGSHTSLCDEASPVITNHRTRSTASLMPIQQQQLQQQQQLENIVPTGIIVTNQLIIEAN
jgi:hypothetical protein